MSSVHTGRSIREGLLLSLLFVSFLLPQASLHAQDGEFSLPDLAAIAVEPRIDAARRELIILFAVKNQGFVRTPVTTVMLYDADTKTLLTEVGIPRLRPGRSHEGEVAIELRDDWPGTTRRILAMVDPNRKVDEIDERNNRLMSDPLRIGHVRRLDVTVTAVQPSFDAARGELVISFEIANRGDAAAPATIVRLYDEETKSLIRDVPIPQFDPHQPYADKVPVRVRDGWRGTSRRFEAVVDPDGEIGETNERNNNRISDPLQIGSIPRPDLVVVAVEPKIDKVISVFVTIENGGDLDAPATTVQLSDVESGSPISSLAIGPLAVKQRIPVKFVVPIGDRRGTTRTFQGHIDPDKRIEESNEENNKTKSKPTLISDQRPDLAMTALEPSIDPAGERLTLFFTVKNLGNSAALASKLDLRDNTTGKTLGEPLDVPSLAANEPFKSKIVVTVKGSWRGTTRTFTGLIDSGKNIDEVNEANNKLVSDGIEIVGPQLDLAVVSFEIEAGETTPIALIGIENLGRSNAPGTDVEVRDAGGGALSEPVAIPALAAGSSSRAEVTLRIPVDWPGGDVTLEAIVDPSRQLVERDRANNRRTANVFLSSNRGGSSVAANVAIAAAAALGGIIAIVWIRRTRRAPDLPRRTGDQPTSQIWTRIRSDPGNQTITSDSSSIVLPALRLRARRDGGAQRIDFERSQP